MATQKGSFMETLAAFEAGSVVGLTVAAEEIMAESRVLCPKDTETLVNSSFIEDPKPAGSTLVCVIGYGRGDAVNPKDNKHPSQYAVPVHEILGVRHAPPTSAKFLELPCLAYEPIFGRTLAIWISRFVKGEQGLDRSFERIV